MAMQNLKRAFVCILLTSWLSAQTTQLMISDVHIAAAKKSIEQELKKNSIMRTVLVATGIFSSIYIGSQIWHHYLHSPESVVNQIQDGRYDQERALGSWPWLRRIVQFARDAAISAALAKGVVATGDSLLESIFHRADIAWFLQTHTHLFDTLKEMEQFAQIIDYPHNYHPVQYAYAQESLFMSLQSLLLQVEFILGFMAYKLEEMPVTSEMNYGIDKIPDYVKACVDDLLYAYECTTVEKKCAMTAGVIQFTSELTALMSRFSHVQEDLTWLSQSKNEKALHE